VAISVECYNVATKFICRPTQSSGWQAFKLNKKFLTTESPVVTLYTTNLTFINSTLCPHSAIYVFYVDLRKKQELFPYAALTGWFLQPRLKCFC
jgi:hypothetical protein